MIVCLPYQIDLHRLRGFVQDRLCEISTLEPNQFPLTERNIVKSNRICAVMYCLHGPRSVKFTAIADIERASLICYGSDGTRHVEEQLSLN